MLILQNISYAHPNKDVLFEGLQLSLDQENKIGLIGNNGSGKSTLLKIIAGILHPSSGAIQRSDLPYYIPQVYGQFDHLTIAQALQVEDKLQALHKILSGDVSETNLNVLNDDWAIEERCREALVYWQLERLDLAHKLSTISGGEKTKVFLAGMSIHHPGLILLDEPSNHLDHAGRHLLYDYIRSASASIIVVSHDRKLLNLLDSIYELSKRGLTAYGGNYDFYEGQKLIERNALDQEVKSKEKTLRKAKLKERETAERKQKLDARGKKKQEKAGIPTIAMNTLRNNAEKSTSRLKEIHAEKTGNLSRELNELQAALSEIDKMKFGFDHSSLHKGKILFTADELNYKYDEHLLWRESLHVEIRSGERIALKGSNGSGKTTLIKIILGQIEGVKGRIYRSESESVYIDQDYSLIDNQLAVYEQAQQFNYSGLEEHEIKIRLNRFLFDKSYWDKTCNDLSGGEKMRLVLCCLTISNQAPDIIVLDEPTNNLDIQNIEILTSAINSYKGTIIVVSHDEYFLEQINIQRVIQLNS